MRKYFYSPRAVQRLADLAPTDDEVDIVDSQVKMLAKTPRVGYLLPFDNPRELRRYDVGRFGLVYQYDDVRLDVITVVA